MFEKLQQSFDDLTFHLRYAIMFRYTAQIFKFGFVFQDVHHLIDVINLIHDYHSGAFIRFADVYGSIPPQSFYWQENITLHVKIRDVILDSTVCMCEVR